MTLKTWWWLKPERLLRRVAIFRVALVLLLLQATASTALWEKTSSKKGVLRLDQEDYFPKLRYV